MKILMRADTHYSIGVRSNEYEKPKYTFSQVGYVALTILYIKYSVKIIIFRNLKKNTQLKMCTSKTTMTNCYQL